MKVAVLGAGPSGLVAAHTLSLAGHDIRIFNRDGIKSQLFGAQYLHAPIEGLSLPDPVEVKYQMLGKADDYRDKVYRGAWTGSVSPEELDADHQAWDIRTAYSLLWRTWRHIVKPVDITSDNFSSFIPDDIDEVVNTIPRGRLCYQTDHKFYSQQVWAVGDVQSGFSRASAVQRAIEDNSIICSGEKHHEWYRASKVFGWGTVEWPTRPLGIHAARVVKPLSTNCDCWSTFPIYHVGRYGEWKKGVLVHHVQEKVKAICEEWAKR